MENKKEDFADLKKYAEHTAEFMNGFTSKINSFREELSVKDQKLLDAEFKKNDFKALSEELQEAIKNLNSIT